MATGPSTTTAPYLIVSQPNVSFTSILTVGDVPPGDDGPFVGIPDGLGAFDDGNGNIVVLVNHELPPALGAVRDHGFTGAFISRIVIDKATLAVESSDDLIKSALVWNTATDSYVAATAPIGRLCSGDLPEVSSFFNASSGLGSTARIYLAGEEVGAEGRLFATIVSDNSGPNETGNSYELPFLGNLSYENALANPYAQDKTIVAITDDSRPGQVYIYVGQKQATGSEIEKAGLQGGDLFGIKVTGLPFEQNGSPASGSFTLQEMGANGDVSDMNGAQLQAESTAEGVTEFLRPEDAAWDPDQPDTLYFVTTGNPATGQPSRLYKLEFTDITNPQAGGTVTMLLQGLGAPGEIKMLDNISVADGKIIMQEDPGNDVRTAKVWEYDIASGDLTELALFNPALFTGAGAITQDEESSGVIDVTGLLGGAGTRAYLLDAQIHAPSGDPVTVEKGQLLAMFVENEVEQGGRGNDELEGNGSAETFRGENGNDFIRSWGGNDFIYGGNGNDRVLAGTGNDQVEGERGDDKLDGGFGNDLLSGGQGADILIGGGDLDTLTGGQGADYFIFDNLGETGDDRITDFSGGDRILLTAQLADANSDGRIPVGSGLALFGTSNLDIENNGSNVSGLRYTGEVLVDGTSYYSYGLDSNDGGAAAFLGRIDTHIAGKLSADILIH